MTFDGLIDGEELRKDLKVITTNSVVLAKWYMNFKLYDDIVLDDELGEVYSLVEEYYSGIEFGKGDIELKVRKIINPHRNKMIEFVLKQAKIEIEKSGVYKGESAFTKIKKLKELKKSAVNKGHS